MIHIGIIGLGWLGTRLADAINDDAKIYTTTRNIATQQHHITLGYHSTLVDFDTANTTETWDILKQLDTIIITIPLPTHKDNILRINNILSFIKEFKGQIICCSSTGIYPNEAKTFVENDVNPLNVATESPFVQHFPQSNILRLGGLMGYDRYLSKYNITQGLDEPVNHVHINDVIGITKLLITQQTKEVILNVVAPLHPTKSEVLARERGEILIKSTNYSGRIINSDLLIKKLTYSFIHPNPLYFKN